MDTPTPVLPDGTAVGRRRFIAGALGTIVGASVIAQGGHLWAAGVEPGASYFVPVSPIRACDTRDPSVGVGFTRLGRTAIRVPLAGRLGIPSGAVAVVLTVTGVNRSAGGNWLSAYPAGHAWPGTSNSNSEHQHQVVANLVSVKLGRGGAVDISSLGPSEVVVDLAGYYMPTSAAVRTGRFEPTEPRRLVDTRPDTRYPSGRRLRAGGILVVHVGGVVAPDAIAVAVNVTVVESWAPGYLTAYPLDGRRPTASCLNYGTGEVRAANTIVKVGHGGGLFGFNIFSQSSAHVVVDLVGYFTGTGAALSDAGLFVPIDPVRIGDTRNAKRRVWPGGTATFVLPEAFRRTASSVVANLTATSTIGPGYFTSYAARTPRRVVSTLNAIRAGQTVANHAISRISAAGLSIFSQSGAHIVCDITGWFTGSAVPITTPAPRDPPPPHIAPPYIVAIPRLGLSRWVQADPNPYRIVDAGGIWHWTGTGVVGQGSNIVLFGHRTEHGGPLRSQHELRSGDMLHLLTGDQRRYNYQWVAEYLTTGNPNDILGTTRIVGGETVSVVSCTKTNRLPTDTRFRLISTFRLVSWDDLG